MTVRNAATTSHVSLDNTLVTVQGAAHNQVPTAPSSLLTFCLHFVDVYQVLNYKTFVPRLSGVTHRSEYFVGAE
jgi:hypothetical protein